MTETAWDLKLALSRELKTTSPPRPDTASPPCTLMQRILSLTNQPETFKEFGVTNLNQPHDQWMFRDLLTIARFCSTLSPLGLDMEACSHPMVEICSGSEFDDGTNQDCKLPVNVFIAVTKPRLSPGFYPNILGLFEKCFQKFGY